MNALTRRQTQLRDAAKRFLDDQHENPGILVDRQLHRDLEWTPTLRFVIKACINVFVEVSEISPYPTILRLKHPDVLSFPEPIAIYAVCPEAVIAKPKRRTELKQLQAHGFGLITVDHQGHANRLFAAIPLVQVIPKMEFKKAVRGLPKRIRQSVSDAFEDYQNRPLNGVKSVAEVLEGLVQQMGADCVKKGYTSRTRLGSTLASVLDELHDIRQCRDIRAQIGGARAFTSAYRNPSNHWPKNKRRAYDKYTECRHAFLDGMRQIRRLREAAQRVGLSGNLPRG